MKSNYMTVVMLVLLFLLTVALYLVIEKNKQLQENQPIDTSKTDSMQVFYSKQLDSIKVENQLLQVKIEAKTETIRTLKGLVNDNNKKYQLITDSALLVELKNIRSSGIR